MKNEFHTENKDMPNKGSVVDNPDIHTHNHLHDLSKKLEKESPVRRNLLLIAHDLLSNNLDDNITELENNDLLKTLQEKFQRNVENFFTTSGISDEITALSIQNGISELAKPIGEVALSTITTRCKGTHQFDIAPNLCEQDKDSGMNCTMGAAMLHLALEKLGYTGVRTVLVQGHHVVFHELDDGSVHQYDPSTTITNNGVTTGYSRHFSVDQVMKKKNVNQKNEEEGCEMIIEIDEEDESGGFTKKGSNGKYQRSYYAYDPNTKLDISIVLENLSEIKGDKSVRALELCEEYPALRSLDFDALKKNLGLFDGYDHLKKEA